MHTCHRTHHWCRSSEIDYVIKSAQFLRIWLWQNNDVLQDYWWSLSVKQKHVFVYLTRVLKANEECRRAGNLTRLYNLDVELLVTIVRYILDDVGWADSCNIENRNVGDQKCEVYTGVTYKSER